MWTLNSLKRLVKDQFKDYNLIVVSFREPYQHYVSNGKILARRTPGGVGASLDLVMQATGGTWAAIGNGETDKKVVDVDDKVGLPPKNPKYQLKRIWLTNQEINDFYFGFSNQTLWPLCHIVYVRPTFDEKYWQAYKKVNEKFAEIILKEVGSKKALIWVQDYQFALLPKLLKEKNPKIKVAQFWHIPWPTYEIFRTCPWGREILQGLLGNDLLGFHRNYHINNFLNSIERSFEARVNREDSYVRYHGRRTYIRSFPIGTDYNLFAGTAKKIRERISPFIKHQVKSPYKHLAVSVDRIDYTKGILERLDSIDRFLEKYPKYQKKFVYVGLGATSREKIPQYRQLRKDVYNRIDKINRKYKKGTWVPIYFIEEKLNFRDIVSFYKSGDLCLVNSLDDGMNLASFEYVASCRPEGVLMLSKFAGASKGLTEAVMINPYNIEQTADKIKLALEMPRKQKIERMQILKRSAAENNVFQWAGTFLEELLKI